MRIGLRFTALPFLWLSMVPSAWAQTLTNDFSDPDEKLTTVGRGKTYISDGVLKSQGNYALFGDSEWKNYTLSFKAIWERMS